MGQAIYFVAVSYSSEIFKPTIVEQFNNEVDANSYAALMCRAKNYRYVVLEQKTEWDGTSKEK